MEEQQRNGGVEVDWFSKWLYPAKHSGNFRAVHGERRQNLKENKGEKN